MKKTKTLSNDRINELLEKEKVLEIILGNFYTVGLLKIPSIDFSELEYAEGVDITKKQFNYIRKVLKVPDHDDNC